jgi:hypothetical protein
MTKYNGHKNHAAWNVSLWINNDEGLYNCARNYVRNVPRFYKNRTIAAQAMLDDLQRHGQDKTPDGVPYSVTTIRAAMVGM